MKKIHYIVAIGLAMVTMLVVSPNTAEGATLDLNGDIIDITASEGQVDMINGTTFISEDFLTDKLYFSHRKDRGRFFAGQHTERFHYQWCSGRKNVSV